SFFFLRLVSPVPAILVLSGFFWRRVSPLPLIFFTGFFLPPRSPVPVGFLVNFFLPLASRAPGTLFTRAPGLLLRAGLAARMRPPSSDGSAKTSSPVGT